MEEGDFFVEYPQLDDTQRAFIEAKFDQNMLITGRAGTGKSLIALHKLSRVPHDKTATVVVYTKVLKKYFDEGMKVLGLGSNIRICYKDGGYPSNSDYVFVDECQDFTKSEIDDLVSRGKFSYFFGDNDQTIMVFSDRVPQSITETAKVLGVRPMELFKNYRLTIPNAILAEYVIKQDGIASHCFRQGQRPSIFTAPTPNFQIDEMMRIIRNQHLTRVGILLPYNTMASASQSYDGEAYMSVEYVRDYMLRKGMPVEYKICNDMQLNFNTHLPKIVSWHSAKGLQFNDVFILFADYNYREEKRKQIYVAITRAYSRLHIGYSGNINTNFFPDPHKYPYVYTLPGNINHI